jgi:hypothetical protein
VYGITETAGSLKQEDHSPRWPVQKTGPYLKNNQSKKSWRCGLSGRATAYQERSPKFKPQYHQKKERYSLWLYTLLILINLGIGFLFVYF